MDAALHVINSEEDWTDAEAIFDEFFSNADIVSLDTETTIHEEPPPPLQANLLLLGCHQGHTFVFDLEQLKAEKESLGQSIEDSVGDLLPDAVKQVLENGQILKIGSCIRNDVKILRRMGLEVEGKVELQRLHRKWSNVTHGFTSQRRHVAVCPKDIVLNTISGKCPTENPGG